MMRGKPGWCTSRALVRVLLLIGCVVLLQGCVPQIYTYHYMSLKNVDGIKVTREGTAEISSLYFHDPMPVQYELAREAYILHLELPVDSYRPEIRISVSSTIEGHLIAEHSPRFSSLCLRTAVLESDGIGFSWSGDCRVEVGGDSGFYPSG